MASNPSLQHLIDRAEALLARIEAVVPHPLAAPDWSASIAFRYRKRGGSGLIEALQSGAASGCGTTASIRASNASARSIRCCSDGFEAMRAV